MSDCNSLQILMNVWRWLARNVLSCVQTLKADIHVAVWQASNWWMTRNLAQNVTLFTGAWTVTSHVTVPRIPSPVILSLAVSVRTVGQGPTVRSTLTSVWVGDRAGVWRTVWTPPGPMCVSVWRATWGIRPLETVKILTSARSLSTIVQCWRFVSIPWEVIDVTACLGIKGRRLDNVEMWMSASFRQMIVIITVSTPRVATTVNVT